MRIRPAIERKKNATHELSPPTFGLPSENFESPIIAAPQSAGHSFSNLSLVQPHAKLAEDESRDHYKGTDAQQTLQPGLIQAKLAISQLGDPLEEEADRMADQVMRTPDSTVQRQCEDCAPGASCPKCEGEKIQRKACSAHSSDVPPTLSSTTEVLTQSPITNRFAHGIAVHAPAPTTIQPNLAISAPGDSCEQEADQLAEQAMRTPKPELQRLQTKHVSPGESGQIKVPSIVHEVLASPGQSLDTGTRAFLESRFGHASCSDVRVHTDAKAAESARAVNALAYTSGRNVVFGSGQYAPGTTEGYRLLAHELAHVEQQRGAAAGASPGVIQRQPLSPAPSPGPSSGATTTPGYVEAAHGPSFRVQIIAHASPRWRGAQNAPDAARRNLELSRRRAEAVRWEVENLLAQHLGTGATVDVDVTVLDQDDTVGVRTEARGSRDTLPEARGDLSDDAQQRRRVDVIVDSSQRVSGVAGAGRPLLTRPTASRFWHVSVDMSAGAAFVAAGGMLALTLINDSSGQSMTGHVFAGGIGPKASLGTSASIWSDPTGFFTDEPKDFKDFDGKVVVQYASGGISLFLGYEWAYLSFLGFGSGARHIDVGGFSVGTAGIGGSTIYGPLLLQGSLPPTELPIKDSDKVSVPYERIEGGKDVHKVLFATESATLSDLEVDVLDSFIASVVASKR